MILLFITLLCLPILLGTGISIFINKNTFDETINLWEIYLYGFICCIGVFEIGHLAGVFLNYSVSDCSNIILVLFAAACVLSVLYLIAKRKEIFPVRKLVRKICKPGIPGCIFLLLLAGQIYYVSTTPMLQTPGDVMMETINSFMVTDQIYSVSPLTGKMFNGVPLRYEILCLPTLYTLLCKWFGISPQMLIDNIIPAIIICVTYIAYYLLSGTLFGAEKNNAEKRLWFMVIVATVFFLCEKMVYMDGYGVLHAGHLGTTIRNGILIPLMLYAALERKYKMAVLCILAEACIVWSFWGLGVCAALFAGVSIIDFMRKQQCVQKLLSKLADREDNL